ncbi:hypothetical protein EVAR_92574_1 [Eumeta japonica]|uniref:Uncharacterized protein n=1 Tax=Eumeta variegata TaxID=151549 RepID=A0A4C1SXA3_EUMVA|nr:hypothetical protein EVAR_92574_1 [Eumeta japonica]
MSSAGHARPGAGAIKASHVDSANGSERARDQAPAPACASTLFTNECLECRLDSSRVKLCGGDVKARRINNAAAEETNFKARDADMSNRCNRVTCNILIAVTGGAVRWRKQWASSVRGRDVTRPRSDSV